MLNIIYRKPTHHPGIPPLYQRACCPPEREISVTPKVLTFGGRRNPLFVGMPSLLHHFFIIQKENFNYIQSCN